MSSCGCAVFRNPTVLNHNTYYRYPNKTPDSSWHVRAERPSRLNYVANGSYSGRNRRSGCGYGCSYGQ